MAIEHTYADEVASTWATRPALAEADRRVGDAEDAVQAVVAQSRLERQEDSSARLRPATAATLRGARAHLAEERDGRRALKQRLYPELKPVLIAVRERRDAANRGKDAYRSYVQSQGLYWATFNDVLAAHKTLVARINTMRRAGKKANLRFRRWQGTGSLCVQLIRGAGRPARAPALLASEEGPWRNVCQLRPWMIRKPGVDAPAPSSAGSARARSGSPSVMVDGAGWRCSCTACFLSMPTSPW